MNYIYCPIIVQRLIWRFNCVPPYQSTTFGLLFVLVLIRVVRSKWLNNTLNIVWLMILPALNYVHSYNSFERPHGVFLFVFYFHTRLYLHTQTSLRFDDSWISWNWCIILGHKWIIHINNWTKVKYQLLSYIKLR